MPRTSRSGVLTHRLHLGKRSSDGVRRTIVASDRPSHHHVCRSGADSFGRGHDARLIADFASGESNARGNNGESFTEIAADGGSLVGGGHQARAAGIALDAGESEDLVGDA